jgi:hypothetical protein
MRVGPKEKRGARRLVAEAFFFLEFFVLRQKVTESNKKKIRC